MIDVAIIPARGGSKGLPGKNIIELGGRPLIVWTIDSALQSGIFNRVIVSTDNDEIAETARLAGAELPFLRPADLATATAASAEVVLHALDFLDIQGSFALLQPTSPFRSAQDLRAAAALCNSANATSLISVAPSKPLSWAFTMEESGRLSRALKDGPVPTRRQDAPQTVTPNGAIYIQSASEFRTSHAFLGANTIGYKMNQIASLDIDDAVDLQIARAIVAAGLHREAL